MSAQPINTIPATTQSMLFITSPPPCAMAPGTNQPKSLNRQPPITAKSVRPNLS